VQVIEGPLVQWERGDVEGPQEEGFEAPTPTSVIAGKRLANQMYRENSLPPTRVIPDGSGGISFELKIGSNLTMFRILSDGTIRYVRLKGGVVEANRTISSSFR
jgi:hypothetical protein